MTAKDSSVAATTIAGAMHEHGAVGEGRDPVFLGEDLDHVGDHLQQAERADAVGPEAVLEEAEQAPLEPDEQRRACPCATREDGDDHEQVAEP